MFKKKSRSVGTKLLLVATLIFGCFLQPEPVLAAVPITIVRVGAWLGDLFEGYLFGKFIDKGIDYVFPEAERHTGEDFERELTNLKRELETKLDRSVESEKAMLQKQLDVTQSQLKTLRELLYSKPGANELAELRIQVKSDISRILAMVAKHEARLGYLYADVRELQKRLQKVEKKLGKEAEPVVLQFNRQNPGASEPAGRGEVAETLAVGDRAWIKSPSPGVSRMAIRMSCDSTSTHVVNVGQAVTITQQCRSGDRFCIRAGDDGPVLGCAAREQLEQSSSP